MRRTRSVCSASPDVTLGIRHLPSRADDVEAEAHRNADVGWVERHEVDRVGQPLCGREVDGVAQANRLRAGQRCGTIEATLIDGHDVEVIPREAYRVLEIEAELDPTRMLRTGLADRLLYEA